jgi:hypothetical protein
MTPDAADGARIFLASVLTGVECSAGETPTEFPTRSVNVRRTGGYKRDMVTDMVQLSIDSRHTRSEAGADLLARQVDAQLRAAVMDGAMGPLTVYSMTTVAGPYDNPDPSNPAVYRSSATYQLAVRMR